MRDAIVIGGGVSGLATAYSLQARGLDVGVLERQSRTGGNATSVGFDGFLMDLGPTTINAAVPAASDWVARLGIGGETVELGSGVRKRYIRDANRLHGVSIHPMGFFASGLLSPLARLSIAAEMLRKKRADDADESIHAFVSRRFGSAFADTVVDPMAAGIFMGDSRALSIRSAFPKLVELERRFGSVTRGILAARRGSEPGRRLFSWREGIGFLPHTLAAALEGRISTGATVTGISRLSAGFEVRTARHGTLRSRTVVLAVQPHVAAALLETLDPGAADAAGDVPAPPVAVVFLGYRRADVAHPLDGLGYLGVRHEGRIITGVQFNSTMFTGRAPEGHVAISAYVGGARSADAVNMLDGDLIQAVHHELSEVLGMRGAPVVARTHRWPRGLPHYTLGHEERRQVLSNTPDRMPGLFVTGNYLSGVSVANCLQSAGETAGRVAAALRRDHGTVSLAI